MDIIEKNEYLNIVDSIVKDAYINGFSTNHIGCKIYAVNARLMLYGYEKTEECVSRYYLNELGIRYVMEGCSAGIIKKMRDTEESIHSTIEMKSIALEANKIAENANSYSAEANEIARKAIRKSRVANYIAFAAMIASVATVIISLLLMKK